MVRRPVGLVGLPAGDAVCDGFTHTYLKTKLPDKICVNFYDVHGGGTTASTFQLVRGASEIQVDGNGDNSISTNAFNISEGANCTTITDLTTHDASNATVGGKIHDNATLNPTSAFATGTITFKVWGPDNPTCSGAPFATTAPVTVTRAGRLPEPERGSRERRRELLLEGVLQRRPGTQRGCSFYQVR